MKLVVSTLCMLALARGDDAIVVVHDPTGCLNDAALRAELGRAAPMPSEARLADASLPDGSVLSVVVLDQLVGDELAVAVKLEQREGPAASLSRVLMVPRGSCPTLAPIVARVVTRHLEALPTSTWPRVEPPPQPVAAVVVQSEDVQSDEADAAHVDDIVELGGVVSVVVGASGFQRVALHGVARRLTPLADLGATVWLGGDVFARLGGLLPVPLDDGHVVGGDAVVGAAARATWSRWSTSLGVEGGVLGVQGVGYRTNTFTAGPTLNAVTTVGVSFSPLWVDLVVRVPLVRATFSGPSSSAIEPPVSIGVAVGGFATLAP